MKKKILALIASGVLTAGAVGAFAGCGGNGDDTISLLVWGSSEHQTILKQMVALYEEANPENKYDIKVGVCEEGEAFANVSKDVTKAADVYGYANDQLVNLLRYGALAQIGGSYLTQIKADNTAESVESGTIAGSNEYYGYPYASDNGYFMFYDKSVLTEDDVQTLEGIISKCESNGKQIAWALDDPWYSAGWFFTYGCDYEVTYGSDNKETSVDCDSFKGEGGIKASKAMDKLASSSAAKCKQIDNSTIITGFTDKTLACAVTGTWNANKIKEKLGDNYAVCKLPTVEVDGVTTQLHSFTGYKLYGVNPHSSNLTEAHKLAQFLASEEMQQLRFEQHVVGPTNKAVMELEAVQNCLELATLNEQNQFAKEQTCVPSKFWEPLKAYAGYIIDGDIGLTSPDPNEASMTYENYLRMMVEDMSVIG